MCVFSQKNYLFDLSQNSLAMAIIEMNSLGTMHALLQPKEKDDDDKRKITMMMMEGRRR
jgi:hypothetical protein